MPNIFKILDFAAYDDARKTGVFKGAAIDLKDGFIHFSSAAQVVETAALHFAGRGNLMLMAVPEEKLGDALKWEKSRGGALFPHLFGPLDMKLVKWAKPLPWNGKAHDFPLETFA